MNRLKTWGRFLPALLLLTGCGQSVKVTLDKEVLMDKIKGGWAGQTIGCTYGGPTEFRYKGRIIDDSIQIAWPDGQIKHFYEHGAGLYDDIYMDLTFVEVFDRLGIDAPVDSMAMAFATAEYTLWHANQAARFNILRGIMPPESGHWLNNPHADDIDYQIEADFAGLMSPGMPNAASDISDKIGHIMNYGDGWYGGVYVGAMYALAFVSDDVDYVVNEALKTIPEQSRFHQCISDIIAWHKQYPDDWKQTWQACEEKWSDEIGCPDGVMRPYNIDAMLNSAYIVIGLLYGEGDFGKTLEISTRCGQDSDCNPASAGGILGTMLGYSNIPEYWMKNLYEVEDIDFAYTTSSLNKTYRMSFEQALQMIERYGGSVSEKSVTIKTQRPVAVRFEQSFEGIVPTERKPVNTLLEGAAEVTFSGVGIALQGRVKSPDKAYVAEVAFAIDGEPVGTMQLPASFVLRSSDLLYWNYQLAPGDHTLTCRWLNPSADAQIQMMDAVIYGPAE